MDEKTRTKLIGFNWVGSGAGEIREVRYLLLSVESIGVLIPAGCAYRNNDYASLHRIQAKWTGF